MWSFNPARPFQAKGAASRHRRPYYVAVAWCQRKAAARFVAFGAARENPMSVSRGSRRCFAWPWAQAGHPPPTPWCRCIRGGTGADRAAWWWVWRGHGARGRMVRIEAPSVGRRRRRHRRLPAGQPPESRRPGKRVLLLEAGGATTTTGSTSRSATSTASATRAPTGCLPDRARPGPERPRAALPARQGAGRLLQHQRHDLHARPGARLRRLGRAHRRPAGAGRLPAVLQEATRTTGAAPTRCTARAASGAWSASACAGTSSTPSRRRRSRPASRHSDDFNRGDNEGVGYFEVNQKRGVRWNAPRPSCGRCAAAQPQVWTGAQVSGCCSTAPTAPRAPASRCAARRGAVSRRAAREVVLCAGAIGSPQLLQLSGIGPAAAARARHRRCVHAARRRREPAGPPADPRGVQGRGREDAQHAGRSWWGKGRIGSSTRCAQRADEHGALAARRLHALVAGAALAEHRVPRAAAVAGRLRRAAAPLQRLHRQRVQPQPHQRGAVRIRSPRPSTSARRDRANYLSTDEDRQVAADSLR
jgi:hypothetical protein